MIGRMFMLRKGVHISVARKLPTRLMNSSFESIRYLSSTDESLVTERKVYEGNFGTKLRSIRRISITSSIVSTIGFPVAISLGHSTVMPLAGQIAMATTVIVTSLASTIFLQLVCHPYVTELYELTAVTNDDHKTLANGGKIERRFRAKKLNMFGQYVVTEFTASQIVPIRESVHPFTSFKVGETTYYVHKESIQDPTLHALF